ncbi:MAG: LPS export ABC transporter ATP-binding protein [Myxococcaceae bacterium]|nr:LPS export ABC transporter ATP-binding protein [Myxococcaceae bacterium]
MTSPSSSLTARGLVKAYRGRRVVAGVDVTVKPGEIVGLLGPNGAGKTTTFNMIVGLVPADAGTVLLDALSLERLPMHERARKGLGYLPQDSSIFKKLTVRQNMLAVLELDKRLSAADRRAKTEATLAEFGLTAVGDSLGETLSGGERRRAEIARSLLPGPRFMLFDEPFAGVDPINVAELQKEIARLKERGLGVLLTDHNVRDTLSICDRAYILADGKILIEGSPADLAASDLARNAYLGAGFKLA